MDTLESKEPDLAVLFFSDYHLGSVREIVDTCHEIIRPQILIGTSAQGVVAGSSEFEEGPSLALFCIHSSKLDVHPLLLEAISTGEDIALLGWPKSVPESGSVILLADPYSFPIAAFLDQINQRYPSVRAIGGMASAASAPGQNKLVIDRTITSEGAVGVILDGIPVQTVVSQGCSPIGKPYVVTKADANVIYELGGKPATERLKESLSSEPQGVRLAFRGLHIGYVADENQVDFERGDFVIRNVVAADQQSGAIAIGDQIDVGRTVQFHVRDAEASHEDLVSLLSGKKADGALLFTCNGRGTPFFGSPHHDASVVSEALGSVPLAGFFCAGEIGPVGTKNFLHGFTASLALFGGDVD
jgi:small ligand-binding sensory domain FIST